MTEQEMNDPLVPDGYITQRRVVCAAIKFNDGLVICGVRHWDGIMVAQVRRLGGKQAMGGVAVQGFIDQKGAFLTRIEAWKIAETAGQILHRFETASSDVLFSENLY